MKRRAPGLTGWLAIVTVLLVTLAVTAVSVAAIGSLRGLAETEARTRVELAVSAAREALRRNTDDLLTAARVLAERPTLEQLLEDGNAEDAVPYLLRYCEGAALDACAVARGNAILSATPDDLDWHSMLASAAEQGDRFFARSPHGEFLLAGAEASLPSRSGMHVLVVRRLDQPFMARLTEQAGLEVEVLDPPAGPVVTGALAGADANVAAPLEGFAANLPLATSTGEVIALIRAILPTAAVEAPLAEATTRMLAIAIAVAALAALTGVVIGRHWISGVGRLTAAARRIGAGDLCVPIARERGKELGILATTLEEMRLSLVELEAARRTRDTVLANISHEFRTPLAAQLASIELLKDDQGRMTSHEQRELVASLERGARRLTRLIDNLLESVRIESGQLTIRHQAVELGDVVTSARELIEPLLRQRGQTLEVGIAAELPMIMGDRQRLVQVLVSLIANASKFGRPDTVIGVGGRTAPEGGIVFWVENEGSGPDATDEAVLFEPFRRARGHDPEQGGLGLGLYVVRSIVERHGGRVTLTRTDEARTRAMVELPPRTPS